MKASLSELAGNDWNGTVITRGCQIGGGVEHWNAKLQEEEEDETLEEVEEGKAVRGLEEEGWEDSDLWHTVLAEPDNPWEHIH